MCAHRAGRADRQGLERSIGLIEAVLITIGAVIGSGIFVAIGPAAESAGRGLLLAMSLAGTVALMNGISSSQLGINYPVSGGTYAFSREVGMRFLGFIAGSAFVAKEVIGLSVIALTFATYSAQVIPGLPTHIVGAGAMLTVTAINVFGLELTTRVLIGLTVAKVAALLAIVGLAMPTVEAAELLPVPDAGAMGILAGAAVFFFAFAGYSRIATIAEEVEEPETTIPRGIIIGFLIAAAIFLLVGAITLGVLGPEETGRGPAPVHAAALRAIGPWGGWLVVGAAWLATLSVLVGGVLGVSRVALAMGKERDLPTWLAHVHPRFKTPHTAILALGVMSALLALLFDLRPLLEVTSVCVLVYYAITNIAALQLQERQRTLGRGFSWIGLGGCVTLVASLPWLSVAIAVGALTAVAAVRRLAGPSFSAP